MMDIQYISHRKSEITQFVTNITASQNKINIVPELDFNANFALFNVK